MTSTTPTQIRFGRLLLTGAAGNLGRQLRPRLKRWCESLRLSDRADLGDAAAGEEIQLADLADRAAVHRLLEGVQAVVHMGGVSTEQSWQTIRDANIDGLVHLYEAARAHGTRRIIFASSNHVTGFYRQDQVVSPRDPVRPDGFYGLSKAFGETLAQLYWDRHQIETVSLRIGSSFPAPRDRRMLATFLSYDDAERLIAAALTAPVVGHSIIYGVSDNPLSWWDNTPARHIGYRAQDSSEPFRAEIEQRQATIDASDTATRFQGGAFVRTGPFFD